MGNNKNPRIVFLCDYCREESSDKPSHYKKKKRHFCSTECYSNYRKYILPKEEQNRYGTGLPKEERELRKWCRSTLNHAIRDGLISRKDCSICGRRAEAHHDDYTRPYDVEWLCFYHHRKLHKIYENPEMLEDK